MATLPPPPSRAEPGDFVWLDWYNQLQKILTTTGSITWDQVSKSGSSIADLQNKNHNLLASIQGGTTNEYYHLTAAQQAKVGNLDLKYGSFYDTTTQSAASINTAYAVTFDTTDISSSVSRGSPTSRIVCATAGIYNLQFSLEVQKASAGVAHIWIWYRVNGTDIAKSARHVAIPGSGSDKSPAWNFIHTMAANDYFELMWAVSDTGITLASTTASSPIPAIPCALLTVNQINT